MKDHCRNFSRSPMTRREMLRQCGGGFGAVAMAALLGDSATGAEPSLTSLVPHYGKKARSVIFLYMDGGPSQVDTFDPKPLLKKESGQPFKMKMEPTQFNNNGSTLGSPWQFKNYGQCGMPVSDLFPHIGRCADDLAVIRSMTSEFSEHTGANYFLHTGVGVSGRPTMGAWVGYGLGSENQNLPGFIVLNGGLIPPGGLENFGNGFLPSSFQGSIFRTGSYPVANIQPAETKPDLQLNKLALMRQLDRDQ